MQNYTLNCLYSSKHACELTTVGTAPGFWTRSAFTTWKTSTTPSVLQRSMTVAMAQNMPLLVTVSLLDWECMLTTLLNYTCVMMYLQCMNIGLFPVFLWTFATSSMVSTTLFGLVHSPSGSQHVMWNWIT